MDRKQKREFFKNGKSHKWRHLNKIFEEKCTEEKANYYNNIVKDLKTSKPGQWYSKVKRMSGIGGMESTLSVEEIATLSDEEQVEKIAEHYAAISNLYKPVKNDDFQHYLDNHKSEKPPNVSPYKVIKMIKKMNKNSATSPGDLPMRIIALFCDDLALPLSHVINCCLQVGQYSCIWIKEFVTPVPKVFPQRNWNT